MLLGLVLLLPCVSGFTELLSEETRARRSLNRFKRNHSDNQECWQRHGVDGFLSVIDSHNHFRPFSGPAVPFLEYIQWIVDHGILFSTMFGIGQKIQKANKEDDDCCYYLHCPNLNYTVVPSTDNDEKNAIDYTQTYKGNSTMMDMIHLTLSMTFPNLQSPRNIFNNLNRLESRHPHAFSWAGEINVFKHALASNGFFQGFRVNEKRINNGELDKLFDFLTRKAWPTTLHCDLGCDNYHHVPVNVDPRNPLKGCEVPVAERRQANINFQWFKDFLGPFYHSFFTKENAPRDNYSKIQHLKVWDALLTKYPKLIVVWAHLGLSKELKGLHPYIHAHVLRELFKKHENLYADISWDVLAKQNLMNHNAVTDDATHLSHLNHTDFNADTEFLVNSEEVNQMREDLHSTWEIHEELVTSSGSVTGPTYSMAVYLELFHEFPDRFLTGTDFVASFGKKENFPGKTNSNGCVKDIPNHARQLTDTSSINMFLEDEAFRKIVLGENFFKITGLDATFAAPPVCGDTMLPLEAIIGIVVSVVVLLLVLVVVAVSVYCCRKEDGASGFSRVQDNRSATTNV